MIDYKRAWRFSKHRIGILFSCACHSHISILAVIVPFYIYAFDESTQGDSLLKCPKKHNGDKSFMELL